MNALALLSNGRLISGSADGTIRVWIPKTGLESRREQYSDVVNTLAALPDGRFAAAYRGGDIRLWDLDSGGMPARLEGHGGPVNALAMLPDGRLAIGSSDTIWLLDLEACAAAAERHDIHAERGSPGGLAL